MEYSCTIPLIPATMVTTGLVYHPLFRKVLIRGVVFVVFVCEGLVGELSN